MDDARRVHVLEGGGDLPEALSLKVLRDCLRVVLGEREQRALPHVLHDHHGVLGPDSIGLKNLGPVWGQNYSNHGCF